MVLLTLELGALEVQLEGGGGGLPTLYPEQGAGPKKRKKERVAGNQPRVGGGHLLICGVRCHGFNTSRSWFPFERAHDLAVWHILQLEAPFLGR